MGCRRVMEAIEDMVGCLNTREGKESKLLLQGISEHPHTTTDYRSRHHLLRGWFANKSNIRSRLSRDTD